jgi:hypothetical protein
MSISGGFFKKDRSFAGPGYLTIEKAFGKVN